MPVMCSNIRWPSMTLLWLRLFPRSLWRLPYFQQGRSPVSIWPISVLRHHISKMLWVTTHCSQLFIVGYYYLISNFFWNKHTTWVFTWVLSEMMRLVWCPHLLSKQQLSLVLQSQSHYISKTKWLKFPQKRS